MVPEPTSSEGGVAMTAAEAVDGDEAAAPSEELSSPFELPRGTPPPGAPVANVQDWYFQAPKTHQPMGPWSVAQLRVRWERHRIDGLTMVWRSGLDAWKQLRDVVELKEVLQDTEVGGGGEPSHPSRGVKRKRRLPLNDMPLTHTYTSNQGVLLVYDSVDNDWKPSEIYEDLVSQEAAPDVEEQPAEAPDAAAKAGEAAADVDDELPLEAREALRELLGDADRISVVGSGGDGATQLGMGRAEKQAANAKAQALLASVNADGTPLTEEQEAKAKKRREYRERKKLKRQAGLFIKSQENRNVYVSGLPPDVTLQELEPVFKRGGVLKVDVDTGDSKIRIYCDDEGRCKGDALVTYANAESVELAVRFLHEFELRGNCRIAVQEADFDEKDTAPKLSTEELKEIASKRDVKEERKKYRAAKNLEKEAVSWSGEMDDGTGRKIVLLKHMFSLEEAEKEGPEFYPELAEEVREECEKVGQVVKVTPIEQHKHGVVSVKFRTSSEAEECIRVMDGRFFAGRTLEASFYDGKTDLRVLGIAKKIPGPASAPAAPAPAVASPPAVGEDKEGIAERTAEAGVAPPTDATAEKPTGEKTWEEWLGGGSDSESDSDTRIMTEE